MATDVIRVRQLIDSTPWHPSVAEHFYGRLERIASMPCVPMNQLKQLEWHIMESHVESICVDCTLYCDPWEFYRQFEPDCSVHVYTRLRCVMGRWVCTDDSPVIAHALMKRRIVYREGISMVICDKMWGTFAFLGVQGTILIRCSSLALINATRFIQRAFRKWRANGLVGGREWREDTAARVIQNGMRRWLDAPVLRKRDRSSFGQFGIRPRLVMRKIEDGSID